jgi:hypothetical protein
MIRWLRLLSMFVLSALATASSQTRSRPVGAAEASRLPSANNPVARSASVGAVVQSSDYDAAKGVTTIHIVNTSSKEISDLDLSIQVTFPDGTVSTAGGSFFGLDFLEGIIQGKGGLAPGATVDQEFTGQTGRVQATVDLVAYADGTADVLNEQALKDLVANRKARVRALQKVNELLNDALANPKEQHPSATVAAQLKSLVEAIKRQKSGEGGAAFYASELQAATQNIANVLGSPRLTEPEFEGNRLRGLIKTHEDRISLMLPHTELVKAVRP